jgi:RHS repeat-associated protein
MKKVYYFLLLLLPLCTSGQFAPSTNKLYRSNHKARVATTNLQDLDQVGKAVISINYLDATGRAYQSVGYGAAPQKNDLAAGTTELDGLGRVTRNYLTVSSGQNNGKFAANVPATAQSFYGDTAPYSEVDNFESSPFNDPLKMVGAGAVFRPGGNKKGMSQFQEVAGSGIRKYIIQSNGTVSGNQTYTDGDLGKNTVTDEDGHVTIEYRGRQSGRLYLVQQKDLNSTTYLTTAYVYDFMGRLRYVVPPKAYAAQTLFTENTTYFTDGIYATKYDQRGRVSETHTPGGGWDYHIYNETGQKVMSQDARQRETNLWMWAKQDGHGRVVMGGTYVTASPIDRNTMQGYFDGSTVAEQFEERSTGSGNLYGYTNRSFPSNVGLTTANVTTVDYYDNYSWVGNSALNFQTYKTTQWTNVKGMPTGSLVKNLGNGQLLKSVVYYDDRGRVTQTYSENRFGAAGVPAINRTDVTLNFAGNLLEERTVYRKPGQADLTVASSYTYDHIGRQTGAIQKINGKVTPIAQYVYDAIGRLSQKNLMRVADDFIVENTAQPNGDVDIANRSVVLNPGTYTATNGTYLAAVSPGALQKIDYSYNVRGQLRGINTDNSGNILLQDGDVFGMKLDHYETAQTYNGKVAGQSWRTLSQVNNQPQNRSYTYGYDGYDRLQSATFSGQGSENYTLGNVSYDANGNISNLQRNGSTAANSWGQIDNLSYAYLNTTVGNRLQGVQDFANQTKGFKDNNGNNDYTYYNDGSLKTDANKGITLIEYNYLGLPEKISFGANQRIENTYDAQGMKLSQKLVDGGNVTQTDYMGGLIYRNGVLETIYHDEGRVKIENGDFGSPKYQFFITDHLGNNRIIIERLNATTALVQETHYYPFGAVMEGVGVSGDWKFLYQGKEFVDGFGYNAYDFGWRQGDSWLGRWMSKDPANQFMGITPYNYMVNNPLSYTDPDGRVVPLIVIGAGAALIGGASNLYSNWGKVKGDWKTGLAYFTSGAIGGAISVTGAGFWGGSAATASLNVGIDVATGNLPSFKNFGDYAEYGLFTGLAGIGSGGAGSISKFALGGGIKSFFTTWWTQSPYFKAQGGLAAIKNLETGVLESVKWAAEVGVQSTKVPLGSVAASAAAKQGASLADDAGRGSVKLLNQFNSAESLISGVEKFSKVKGGVQGFVQGDGGSIFNAITQGAKPLPNGRFLLSDGTNIGKHISAYSGDFTINMNRAGKLIKIRIIR